MILRKKDLQKFTANWLPFADAASEGLPLPQLLRLSLFQVSVGMAQVLLLGTLNRVMIVELSVPALIVAAMIAIPVLVAPFRALLGHRSDTHRSALGWKRVPYLWFGSLWQMGGLAIMPFALLVLSGGGEAGNWPVWIGQAGAGLAFLLVGAGLHTTQTVGLALATDLSPIESQPKVVGLMYVMLLFGMIGSAFLFGALLEDFSPARLIQVVQGAAVATLLLNLVALWKQETRNPKLLESAIRVPTFKESWSSFTQGDRAVRRLIAVGLGTMGFSMGDVLLEPYGGEILHLTVSQTTMLTATLALGGLSGFALASRVLARGFDPFRMACHGAAIGAAAFVAVILAAYFGSQELFALGTAGIGFGAGLFGHGTLTATMNLAPEGQKGLALGSWGAVQASAAGAAIALGGVIRDASAGMMAREGFGPAGGYITVYGLEAALLVITLGAMLPLLRRSSVRASPASA